MKLTVENFCQTNVKIALHEWDKESLREIEVFAAQLIIEHYQFDDEAPKNVVAIAEFTSEHSTGTGAYIYVTDVGYRAEYLKRKIIDYINSKPVPPAGIRSVRDGDPELGLIGKFFKWLGGLRK